jgi:hypothetical protein
MRFCIRVMVGFGLSFVFVSGANMTDIKTVENYNGRGRKIMSPRFVEPFSVYAPAGSQVLCSASLYAAGLALVNSDQ